MAGAINNHPLLQHLAMQGAYLLGESQGPPSLSPAGVQNVVDAIGMLMRQYNLSSTSGLDAVSSTSGLDAVSSTSGLDAVSSTSGLDAVSSTSGLDAVSSTSGLDAVSSTSGLDAVSSTSGLDAVSSTSGNQQQLQQQLQQQGSQHARGDVADAQKSGRPRKLNASAAKKALKLLLEREHGNSAAVAQMLYASGDVNQ
ncbi:hypothetical protein CEUSTIGMA_g7032.t1 [Chlamydomonas eustigma]|uniref:Uncharacterized protein n=1 Tax=Chlamydomonas eustigma TaxID=1157962 RepID=A0A250X941_9CHLO|nr:hypothetical protein CEUSTIGMA_g7032.t1 [Chlamydomonas eustigma]|eukprot:GAX79591.1 hypothetical protein CEUSTIGMA_g7032.t1 [Chlamydomonas eustigma]